MAEDAVIKKQIMELIQNTNDPNSKALLLILFQINESLANNTTMTKALVEGLAEHRSEFQKHEQTEMALINQGRGWMKSSIFFLGVLQAIALALGTNFIGDHTILEKRVGVLEQFAEGHRQHHAAEESAKGKHQK